jgi:hypothetical protein
MTHRTRACLLTSAVTLVLAATPGAAYAGAGFTVPSGRTICGLLTAQQAAGLGAGLYCTSANIPSEEAEGGVRLTHRGKAKKFTTGNDLALLIDGDQPKAARPTLAYGKTFTRDGYRCVSRSTGLTCRRGSHGFFVARESQRYW